MVQERIKLSHLTKKISGTVRLTGSKSESNRALIIQALSKGQVKIENLSEAADTAILTKALQIANDSAQGVKKIDIGPAGTAMRFLTSYLNTIEGNFTLTGTARMQERPISILVDALKTVGAHIDYSNNEGYPPLQIEGGMQQQNNLVTIKGSVSSQYLSSLLLIASSLTEGLILEIEGELTSRPYVTMTLDMLKEAGIIHEWNGNKISINPQQFTDSTIYIEPDWSAASYWYAIVALANEGEILLPGLKKESLQGDIAIVDIMKHFGVTSTFEENGLRIRKDHQPTEKQLFDFKECPDLAQTVVVIAAALRKDVSFTGLETLKIKETDRIAALQNEIGKFGCKLIEEDQIYHLHTADFFEPNQLSIATYEDHRMAMAFAPLALVFNNIEIQEPQVVDKSYPDFWKHLQEKNFLIQE